MIERDEQKEHAMIIQFDEDNLLETAKVVIQVNEYMRDQTPQNMVEHMKRTAYSSGSKDLGYVSTAGYVLSFFKGANDNEICVKASISTHTVERFLEKSYAKLAKAHSDLGWALAGDRQGGA